MSTKTTQGNSTKSKRVLIFAGTRPEIIKLAPVAHALKKSEHLEPVFCFTGQHREMALPFLKFFDLPVDHELQLMAPGQSLGALTSRASMQMDEFLAKNGPFAAVLVQGDTTTAFVGALTAFYHRIPVGHVEAGLRTADIMEPFPEELNRRLITRVARWHYAPTPQAAETLCQEKVSEGDIVMTGNTGIDALLWTVDRARETSHPKLRELGNRRIVLVTAHRRENIGEPLARIVLAILSLAQRFTDVTFVLPVHKNPAVEKTVRGSLSDQKNILLLDPLEYPDLVWVMNRAELILSDSGGIQEEAPSLKKPVLVLRNDTERPEAVDYGTSILMGSDKDRIVEVATAFLTGQRKLKLKDGPSPYGDGSAAVRTVEHLVRVLN